MDQFDLKILVALQRDGRLSNLELAGVVGLSASQCSRRRVALENAGIISGYHAQISPQAVGLDVAAIIHVTLSAHSRENAEQFHLMMERLDEVQEVHTLTGEADYMIKVVVADLGALSELLNNVILTHETVHNVRSSIVLNTVKQSRKLPISKLHRIL